VDFVSSPIIESANIALARSATSEAVAGTEWKSSCSNIINLVRLKLSFLPLARPVLRLRPDVHNGLEWTQGQQKCVMYIGHAEPCVQSIGNTAYCGPKLSGDAHAHKMGSA
jgi:hypothetical protein